MCTHGCAPDDPLMQPRPRRTGALLLVVAAVVLAGSMAWPRADASGGKAPAASSPTIPASPTPPTTVVAATGLDPGIVAALDAAVAAARQAGHHLSVTSGFRTVAEQDALLDEAI